MDWVNSGKGRIIYGGEHYNRELRATNHYHGILTEMRRSRKAEEINGDSVDNVEREIINIINNENCDDTHIIAIVIVSRCRLICSKDKNSYIFLKDKSLYPNGCPIPKIYGSKTPKIILQNKDIVNHCGPCSN